MGEPLSKSEVEILQALCNGRSTKQIAVERWNSPETIKSHLRHIYRKLGLDRWGQERGGGQQVRAVVRGLQLGLIQLPALEA